MKLRNLALAALFSLIVVGAAEARCPDGHAVRIKGVIAAVGDAGILVHLRNGNEVRVNVVERTVIIRNGERARLGDLQVRDRVKIKACRLRDHVVAAKILARGRG